MMKIVSINAGLPRKFIWKDREVVTAIFKSPIEVPTMLRRLNLDGDRQADLENHGGRSKAVYAYPAAHYAAWRAELPGVELAPGMFGENFTVEGLQEDEACIGDQFRFGQATLTVTQPRIPCYKLALRFDRDDMAKRFLQSNRSGVYFQVLEEGFVAVGDAVERIKQDEERISVLEINRAFAHIHAHLPFVRRLVLHPLLPHGLREHFIEQLALIDES
jgi:MOSC domain-containing protein YiiM